MRLADKIRTHGLERYVVPAREKKLTSFSIRAGDVLTEMGMGGDRAPAVCSALKTHQFLEENHLLLVDVVGPKSGQSTTVTYTYRFADMAASPATRDDAWGRLRGALKDVFAEMGGGEAYLRAERSGFYGPREGQ